jgi:ABC-2 type transport system permease protein
MSARQAITLVAWREIHERLHSRAFLASTLLMLALVGAASVLSLALSTERTYKLAVVAPVPKGLDAALQRAAKPFEAKVKIDTVASAAAGREQVNSKKVDVLLLLATSQLVFRNDVDAQAAAAADSAVRALRHHLPLTPELTAVTLQPPAQKTTDAKTLAAYAGALLLLTTLALYGQWVLTGVVEEKSNRVVELILATVRPRHLMAGKVIGIGLLGLGQVALVGGLTAVLLASGLFDAPTSLGANLALVIPWFALGFALYAVAYAAAGALASQQQDANSAGIAVTYTLLAAFFLGYLALASDMNGLPANLLTIFPLTAPLVLPARSILIGVPLWEHALAAALVLATIYALIRLAGRIYAQALLRSGPRIGLRDAMRLARQP